MKKPFTKAIITLTIITVALSMIPTCFGQDYLTPIIAVATLAVGLGTFAFFKTRRNRQAPQTTTQTATEASSEFSDYSI